MRGTTCPTLHIWGHPQPRDLGDDSSDGLTCLRYGLLCRVSADHFLVEKNAILRRHHVFLAAFEAFHQCRFPAIGAPNHPFLHGISLTAESRDLVSSMTLESPIFGSPLDDLVPKMTFLSSGKEGAIKGATGIHIPYLFPIRWGAGQGATNGVSQPSYSFATSASFGHETSRI